ncbi:8-amino-7-oxononanoate synthase [Austwickia sp. TVS 96-490-7B]|uniref:aminotransferase class I/II-fold pyridoxal phosphate-dependent enzyme n=1 Tax=Austwickia sp. TVS 96-490-7B TaxID=2830843 RepID=UPI001DC438B1|nr:aminotransferase class I/II-fold pyridoxal phosphate-dependent enzyme [Austwickia sp. TVS 96-490-7B]MBW3083894.1 8-amino-7-oxononanoate synthase [Austwickia sp. TVS 96-490-7B]
MSTFPHPPLLTHLAASAARRRELGLQREADVPGCVPTVDLAGNDYLGLLRHPSVIDGAVAAARRDGGGAGASRVVTGTTPTHRHLEVELAGLLGVESALVCSTGYHANLAAVTTLGDADTLIVSDAHVHASLVDGARLARGEVAIARHNDLDQVRDLLRSRQQPRALVVVESVYSVYGDAAPLADLVALTAQEGATLLVDEAHGIGVVGPGGGGGLRAADVSGQSHVVVTGTLSKSLAAQGGLVAGVGAVRDHVLNTARPFIYDTGLAPAAAGAALGALAVLRDTPDLPGQCRDNAARLAAGLGLPTPAGAVLAMPMPGPDEAVAAVAAAAARGLRIGCFRPPSTPDGGSWLRFTAHASHDTADVDWAIQVIREVTTAVDVTPQIRD